MAPTLGGDANTLTRTIHERARRAIRHLAAGKLFRSGRVSRGRPAVFRLPTCALRSADRDEDVAALDLHIVARDLQIVGDALAGAHVVLPGVPRTGDDAAFEVALAERPAAVRALVVQRVERAVDVEERDLLPVHRHELARSG